MELGNHEPMQLLMEMRQLLGDRATLTDGPLLRELFLQWLPLNICMVLAVSLAGKNLEEIAEQEDRIIDVAPPSEFAITTPTTSEVEALRTKIKELKDLVSLVAATHPPTSCSLSPRRCQLPRLRSSPPRSSSFAIFC